MPIVCGFRFLVDGVWNVYCTLLQDVGWVKPTAAYGLVGFTHPTQLAHYVDEWRNTTWRTESNKRLNNLVSLESSC